MTDLFQQLAQYYRPGSDCAVRRDVLNNEPENEIVIRRAIDDLKLLGITELIGLKDPSNPDAPRSPRSGIEATVYEIPGMSAVVRFKTGGHSYRFEDRNKLLGSTKPDDKAVMQPFMEFGVPNPVKGGKDLYIEICALGKPISNDRAGLVDWTRRYMRGITGRNRQPMFKDDFRTDMGSSANNMKFGNAWMGYGTAMLIDTGEVDDHLFNSPSQRTDWSNRPEYHSLTEAGKKGAWLDPKKHHELYMRQLERRHEQGMEEFLEHAQALKQKLGGSTLSDEDRKEETNSLIMEYFHLQITRFGETKNDVAQAIDKVKELTSATISSDNIRMILSHYGNGRSANSFKAVLAYGLKEKMITPDFINETDHGISLLKRLCAEPSMLKAAIDCVGIPALRETETEFSKTILLKLLNESTPDMDTLRILADMPGSDIAKRNSHGDGYIDYVTQRYNIALRADREYGSNNASEMKLLIGRVEAVLKEKGIDPAKCCKPNGVYADYAEKRAHGDEIKHLNEMAWKAKGAIPLP